MTYRRAEELFAALAVMATILMLWQSALQQNSGWSWQGIGAVILCAASIVVRLKWVRCPHCGKPIARGAKTHCTYCGKPCEETEP